MKTLLTLIIFGCISTISFAQSELNNAIRDGKLAAVKELVKANPGLLDKYIEYQGYPLHLAARNINPAIVEWILTQESKVNVNTKDKKHGNAIYCLCEGKYLKGTSSEDAKKVLDMLVKAGGDINAKGKDGFTPLQLTLVSYTNIPQTNLPFIQYMLEKGANPKTVNKTGRSSVMSICRIFNSGSAINAKLNMSRFEIVKALIEHGADPNTPDPSWDKNTPIIILMSKVRGHFPTKKDKHAVIKWLIENGAKTNTKNKKGESAKSIAKSLKKTDKELYKIVKKTKAKRKKRK